MSRVPATRPAGTTEAGWRDYGRLLRIATSAQLLVTWKQTSLRVLMIMLVVVLAVEGVFLSLMAGTPMMAVILFGLVIGGTALFMVAHTACRIADRHRLVLLAKDRRSGVDVRFGRDGSLTPSNHGRLLRATSAGQLRENVAAWVLALPGVTVKLKAQNQVIADLYIAQFPALTAGTPDVLGRVPLTVAPVS